MNRFGDLIDFTLCVALALVSLAATIWLYAQLIAFDSDASCTAIVHRTLAAAGVGGA